MVKIVYALFYAISLLPFRLLYCIADFEYFMMYRVIKYRRGIVRKNLTTSFPEKSEEEIVDIEKKFYRWFSDYFFEAAFDELFKRIRSHEENGVVVPKKDILRYLVDYKRKGIMSIFGYISDQGPKWENIHLWLPFLNHPETPVFTGGERIMRKMNDAVFYVEMSRPKRGYYTATYKLITREPNSLPEHEITRRFFQMLEETIRKNPPYYLWTHNRWKRTREEFDKRYEIKNGKVIPKES